MKKVNNRLLILNDVEACLICRKEDMEQKQLPFTIFAGAKLAKDPDNKTFYIFGYNHEDAEKAYNHYMEEKP